MQRLKSQTGMKCPPPPSPITKKRSKLPRVKDQTDPSRVDPYEESNYIEQKLPIPTQATQPSSATREKYTKKLK